MASWRHQMEIFYALLAICADSSPVTGVNNRVAGDLRRHLAHHDVTVMGYHVQVRRHLGPGRDELIPNTVEM